AAQDKENSKDSDDIVVTAQRREQKLQDVGIAVSVMTADSLRDMNVQTATDLTRAVPELKMNAYSSSQVVFNIRGVSQNDYGDQQEPPVAVYQDDSYSS
ncbi:TonB-dependent receptor plug domain-containing protein, partial [Mycobacterium tuberculosis]